MKRVVGTLNEFSFELPTGYGVTSDRYMLQNGQGFLHRENYLSQNGNVISLFEVHRNPEEFLEKYKLLTKSYRQFSDKYELCKFFYLKIKNETFPVFIIRGYHKKLLYVMQVFVECDDCLGCFMINLKNYDKDFSNIRKNNEIFEDLIKLLRTIEWKSCYCTVVAAHAAHKLLMY